MRVLISLNPPFCMSREAVNRARELGAAWASLEYIPLKGEPGYFDETASESDVEFLSLPSVVPRHDAILLQVFDELGDRFAGFENSIVCLDLPDDVTYYVSSYFSAEWISEQHRCWGADIAPGSPASSSFFHF